MRNTSSESLGVGMALSSQTGLNLTNTYLHLEDGPGAVAIRVDDDFWQTLNSRTDLNDGRLVCNFQMSEDWAYWEMHPAGDEIVYLLSGAIDFIYEQEESRVVELRGRVACIVPRGVWHRAIVHRPSEVLTITRGAGTNTDLSKFPHFQRA